MIQLYEFNTFAQVTTCTADEKVHGLSLAPKRMAEMMECWMPIINKIPASLASGNNFTSITGICPRVGKKSHFHDLPSRLLKKIVFLEKGS